MLISCGKMTSLKAHGFEFYFKKKVSFKFELKIIINFNKLKNCDQDSLKPQYFVVRGVLL